MIGLYYLYIQEANKQIFECKTRIALSTRSMFIMRALESYLSTRVVKTVDLDPNQTYLFAGAPHGIFGVGIASVFLTDNGQFSKAFPNLTVYPAAVTYPFVVPLSREVILHAGVIPAKRKYILTYLQNKRSVLIVPGGASEALVSGLGNGKIYLVLKERYGFVECAVETGAHLVPAFCFGEGALYEQYNGNKLTFGLQEGMRRLTGFTTPMVKPNSQLLPFLPNKHAKVSLVVGTPIPCQKMVRGPENELAFSSYVKRIHQQYCDAIVSLHAKYAPTLGSKSEQELKIISSKAVGFILNQRGDAKEPQKQASKL